MFSVHNPNIKPHTGSHFHHLGSRNFMQTNHSVRWCWRCSSMTKELFTTSLFWKSVTSVRPSTEIFFAICRKLSILNTLIFRTLEQRGLLWQCICWRVYFGTQVYISEWFHCASVTFVLSKSSPCWLIPVPRMKALMNRCMLQSAEEMKWAIITVLKKDAKKSQQECFQQWYSQWQKCDSRRELLQMW